MLRTMVAAGLLVGGVALPAAAYGGPGTALSVLGALLGLLLASVVVLGAALLAPLRWLRERVRADERPSPPL